MERPTDREDAPRRPTVWALLCTFHRSDAVAAYVDALEAQVRRPDVLLVIDNGGDDALRDALVQRSSAMEIRYLRPPANIGPAGALDLGLSALSDELAPDDLVVHCDDDDPPVRSDQLAVLLEALDGATRATPKVAGIGLSGGRLRARTGMIAAIVGDEAIQEADHLHGGYLPVYRADALLDVGGNDPTFFYGFEELELGRRLRQRGWKLLVHKALMDELVDRYPKRQRQRRRTGTIDDQDLGWSRFHKERNLIRVLRRERRWTAIAVTVLVRHLALPVLALPRQPRAAWRRLRLGVQAALAGLRDAGGIDPRFTPKDGGRT